MDVPKKWWWLVGVAVPIVVAAIAIVPDVLSKDGGGGGETFTVIGTQVNDPVTFNNFSVVVEQARRAGAALPDSVREILREAEQLARSSNFAEVIALLESVSDAAPVPALFNNLGAAYWATGDSARARQYLQQALAVDPDEETARINLSQTIEPGPAVAARLVNFSSQHESRGCYAENILDGRPDRGWCSAHGRLPQTLIVELPGEFLISKFSFDNYGRVAEEEDRAAKDIQIYVSLEAADLGYREVGTFTLKAEIAQGFILASPVRARWIKLNILSNHGNTRYTELMEFRAIGVPAF